MRKEVGKGDIRKLGYFALAMIGVVFFLVLFALLVHYSSGPWLSDTRLSPLVLACIMIGTLIVIIYSNKFYRRNVNMVKLGLMTRRQRLGSLRAITLMFIGYCEYPALISILGFLFFGDFAYFIPAAVLVVEMFRKFPHRSRVDEVLRSAFY